MRTSRKVIAGVATFAAIFVSFVVGMRACAKPTWLIGASNSDRLSIAARAYAETHR